MEGADDILSSRPRRPQSSTSSMTKFTPQSSNGSSTNFTKSHGSRNDTEWNQGRGNTERASPGSLLQERLREKKAARLSERRKSMDIDTFQDRGGVQSSPVGFRTASRAGRDRDARRPSSSGKGAGERVVGKKGMGIKEMEEAVSNLHKKNFDLKLELYHRRQRQTEMEERLEAAEKLAEDVAEIQQINEQLVVELEKRDQAVEEAVGIICTLEEKIDRLMREREMVRTIDAGYQTTHFRSRHRDDEDLSYPPSSPPQFNNSLSPKIGKLSSTSRSIARMPSFLSEQGEGAEALRSLYLPTNNQDSRSTLNLPKLREENRDEHENGMNSPRLSVLSESSFRSVYGEKTLALEGLDLDEGSIGPPASWRHRRSLSVEKWMDNPATKTGLLKPSQSRNVSPPAGQYMSINDILESPLQRLEKLQQKLSRQNEANRSSHPSSIATAERTSERRQEKENQRDNLRRTELTAFDHKSALPPTPDTISTSTLRRYKNSNDTLHRDTSSQQDRSERLYLDHPLPTLSHTNMIRPRSACETVTSRREGHGWDTVTTSELSGTNSEFDVKVESTLDPWMAIATDKQRRTPIQPPDMFTFNGGSDDEDWGRDMMFNGDVSRRHYDPVTDLRSDDTIQPNQYRSRREDSYQLPVMTPALDSSPKPNPPERRSSLAAQEKKIRKQPPQNTSKAPSSPPKNSMPPTLTAAMPSVHPVDGATATTPSKLSRITNRFLGRGLSLSGNRTESLPVGPPQPQSAVNPTFDRTQNYKHTKRLSADLNLDLHSGASATPPPISRYPRGGGGPAMVGLRPSSAGGYAPGGRRSSLVDNVVGQIKKESAPSRGGDTFGVDGAYDERDDSLVQGQGPGGKKWFGLSRNGSLRR